MSDGVEDLRIEPKTDSETIQMVNLRLFNTAWRIGREQLRQQEPTLRVLFDAAKAAADSRPGKFPVNLDQMRPEDEELISEWFDKEYTARGARDAYASAIILFVDNLLKEVLRFYRRIDGLPQYFHSGVNGTSTDRIFRFTGNNIRHYDEWSAPTHEIPQRKQAYDAVKAICPVLGRPVPPEDSLSVMASNWAWPVIATVSKRAFAGLLTFIREFLDELVITRAFGTTNSSCWK